MNLGLWLLGGGGVLFAAALVAILATADSNPPGWMGAMAAAGLGLALVGVVVDALIDTGRTPLAASGIVLAVLAGVVSWALFARWLTRRGRR